MSLFDENDFRQTIFPLLKSAGYDLNIGVYGMG